MTNPAQEAETAQAEFRAGKLRAKGYAVFDAKGRCIALTNCESASAEEEDAYARLFAAAPELYAALEAVKAGFADGSIKWAKQRKSDSDPYHPANVAMCAALAKATGD